MIAHKWGPLMMRRLAGGAVMVSLLVIMACGQSNTYAPPPLPQVTVAKPVHQLVADYLEFTGNTQAINTVQLKARVQGFLEKVFFKDGDVVKKGQLLFLIQPNTYEASLAQASAQILQQKANYDHAVIETNRYTKLVQQKAAAQTDLDNWRLPAGRLPGGHESGPGGPGPGQAEPGLHPGGGPLHRPHRPPPGGPGQPGGGRRVHASWRKSTRSTPSMCTSPSTRRTC